MNATLVNQLRWGQGSKIKSWVTHRVTQTSDERESIFECMKDLTKCKVSRTD